MEEDIKKRSEEPSVKRILQLLNCGVRADSKRSVISKSNRILQNWVEVVENEEILGKFSSIRIIRRGKNIVLRILDVKQ